MVDHITEGRRYRHVAARNHPARLVGDVVDGQHIQPRIGLDHAAVDQVLSGAGAEVVGGFEGAAVIKRLACDQVYIVTGNQRPIGFQAAIGFRQVHHRHQHFFAVHNLVFQPHDVVSQRSDLLAA